MMPSQRRPPPPPPPKEDIPPPLPSRGPGIPAGSPTSREAAPPPLPGRNVPARSQSPQPPALPPARNQKEPDQWRKQSLPEEDPDCIYVEADDSEPEEDQDTYELPEPPPPPAPKHGPPKIVPVAPRTRHSVATSDDDDDDGWSDSEFDDHVGPMDRNGGDSKGADTDYIAPDQTPEDDTYEPPLDVAEAKPSPKVPWKKPSPTSRNGTDSEAQNSKGHRSFKDKMKMFVTSSADNNNNSAKKSFPQPPKPRPIARGAGALSPPEPTAKPTPPPKISIEKPKLPSKPKPSPISKNNPPLPPNHPRRDSVDENGSASSMSSGSGGQLHSGGQLPSPKHPQPIVNELKQVLGTLKHVHVNDKIVKNFPPIEDSQGEIYTDGTSEHPLAQFPWFHETVDGKEAVKRVTSVKQEGAFLVRPSQGGGAQIFVLVVLSSGDKINNLRINERRDGQFAIGSEKPDEMRFASVDALIDYHWQHNITLTSGGSVKLSKAAQKR